MDDIEDEDFILYLLLAAAVAYFLYKNNVFGAPAISAPALPALPAPTVINTPAPTAAATSTAAAQGPAGSSNELLDFGMDAAAGW